MKYVLFFLLLFIENKLCLNNSTQFDCIWLALFLGARCKLAWLCSLLHPFTHLHFTSKRSLKINKANL